MLTYILKPPYSFIVGGFCYVRTKKNYKNIIINSLIDIKGQNCNC